MGKKAIKTIDLSQEEAKPASSQKEKKQSKKKRWGKLPASVRKRSGIDSDADEATRSSQIKTR